MLSLVPTRATQARKELDAISKSRTSPFVQTNQLVQWAQKFFAWGLKPLKALIGFDEDQINRGTATALANPQHTDENIGGASPEIHEVAIAKKSYDECPAANKSLKRRLWKKLESEFADVLMMVLAWGHKMGIDIDKALKSTIGKLQKRFGHILRLAQDKGIQLEELKKSPEQFNKIWGLVKKHGADAGKHFSAS